jgi:O-antigen/teichoic acid export membrane protein
VLADPICRLIYGPEFASAALPLQLMGPGVLLIGFVTLTTSLLVSRGDPRRMASLSGIMVVANVALNFALIPLFDVAGAAAAITATEVVFAVWIAHRAVRMVGKIEWLETTVGALAGGLAMAAVAVPLHNSLAAALAAGLLAYLVALLAVDRLVSPRDVAFVMGMVRRRLPSRSST